MRAYAGASFDKVISARVRMSLQPIALRNLYTSKSGVFAAVANYVCPSRKL